MHVYICIYIHIYMFWESNEVMVDSYVAVMDCGYKPIMMSLAAGG